jgi:hypothetical protein
VRWNIENCGENCDRTENHIENRGGASNHRENRWKNSPNTHRNAARSTLHPPKLLHLKTSLNRPITHRVSQRRSSSLSPGRPNPRERPLNAHKRASVEGNRRKSGNWKARSTGDDPRRQDSHSSRLKKRCIIRG